LGYPNLRTGKPCDNENALLVTILADATNLGLTRIAAASQGVTRDQLIWIADAYTFEWFQEWFQRPPPLRHVYS
jgi:Tn3 transposase DDE domain